MWNVLNRKKHQISDFYLLIKIPKLLIKYLKKIVIVVTQFVITLLMKREIMNYYVEKM